MASGRRGGSVLLDEWHIQVETATDVSFADAEHVGRIVSSLLVPFCESLETALRAETGLHDLEVVYSL